MSAALVAELKAAGRRLDAAKARFFGLTSTAAKVLSSDPKYAEWEAAHAALELVFNEYRTLLEDVTEQHADVILRRLT